MTKNGRAPNKNSLISPSLDIIPVCSLATFAVRHQRQERTRWKSNAKPNIKHTTKKKEKKFKREREKKKEEEERRGRNWARKETSWRDVIDLSSVSERMYERVYLLPHVNRRVADFPRPLLHATRIHASVRLGQKLALARIQTLQ